MISTKNLVHAITVVNAYGPATPSSATPDYISLKNAHAVEVVVTVQNGSTVTGSAVTLQQARAVAGTNAKALAFTEYWAMTDPANSNNYTNTAASSNTFTTVTTNSAKAVYRIPVDPATLDTANGFDCLSVGLANAVNTTVSAEFIVVPKYGGNEESRPSLIID